RCQTDHASGGCGGTRTGDRRPRPRIQRARRSALPAGSHSHDPPRHSQPAERTLAPQRAQQHDRHSPGPRHADRSRRRRLLQRRAGPGGVIGDSLISSFAGRCWLPSLTVLLPSLTVLLSSLTVLLSSLTVLASFADGATASFADGATASPKLRCVQ